MTQKRISPYKENLLAYAAGFFDGEGTVSVVLSTKGAKIRASIVNTNKDVLEYLQKFFGGRIAAKKCVNPDRHKQAFTWSLDGSDSADFLMAIKYHTIIKREQISIIEFFYSIRNTTNRAPSAEYTEYVTSLKKQINWLNRKGPRLEHDIEPIPYKTGSVWAPDDYRRFN
jgi:hypothetical protein